MVNFIERIFMANETCKPKYTKDGDKKKAKARNY